jgi:DNA-binding PadR family transcriptional regulator
MELSPLAGALLGLIGQEPRSGYALRKVFATTPMGVFSDSPGSIYPALKRLAGNGLIAARVENARTLRPRKVYELTAGGRNALGRWLAQPVTRDLVTDGFDLAMLRFVFMPDVLGYAATVDFVAALEAELTRHIADLEHFHRAHAREMPLAPRLGLQSGIEGFRAHARWAARARRTLARPAARERRREKQR